MCNSMHCSSIDAAHLRAPDRAQAVKICRFLPPVTKLERHHFSEMALRILTAIATEGADPSIVPLGRRGDW